MASKILNPPELEQTQTLVLAGGNGDRLRPLTDLRPKPTVSFGGMFRIIDFTLSNCFYSGLRRVSLLTQYKHDVLHRYVREAWGELWSNTAPPDRSRLLFLPPPAGGSYKGTADAVFQNCNLLQSDGMDFVLVVSSDHIYHMDYRGLLRQHAESGADLTIGTVEYPISGAGQFGVLEVDRDLKVTSFEEKPENPRPSPHTPSNAIVSMGVYVFRKDKLVASLRQVCETGIGYDFGRDIIPWLLQSGRTDAYIFRDDPQNTACYWRDIGTVDAYYEASMDLVQPHAPFNPYSNALWQSRPTRHPSFNGHSTANPSRCMVGRASVTRSILAPDIELADNASVDQSVLMPGVRVGNRARLRRAIVDEGVHIPADFEVGYDLDRDRRLHTVTDGGVVVVSRTPVHQRPTIMHFTQATSARRTSALEVSQPVRRAVNSFRSGMESGRG